MAETDPIRDPELPAGDFSSWLEEVQDAIRGSGESDVPCDGCTACCTSSQFVHIAPDETAALARIPAELLFPVPGLPRGHVLLGYDQRGRCPMLIDDGCSIYADRPRTCRTYDCRVFPAAGLTLADEDKAQIRERARRWSFSFPSDADRIRHAAVRAAAAFLDRHAALLPTGTIPTTTQHAVLAIEIHDLFLDDDRPGSPTLIEPDPEAVAVEVAVRTKARRAG